MTNEEKDTCGRESAKDPIAGFLSGLMLTTAGVFPALSPIQSIAFVPLLFVLRRARSRRQRLDIGLLMGLGFIAPQVVLLRLPPLMAVALVAYFLILIVAFVYVSSFVVHREGIWSSLAFGALLVVLDWIAITAFPMWGSAQSFVRSWSWYPKAIAFTSITGISGILFVLGVTQSLGVTFVVEKRRRIASLVGLVATLAIVAGIDVAVLTDRPSGHLKVAAVGWRHAEGSPDTPHGFRTLCEEPIVEAARCGVRLIVFPEMAFGVSDEKGSAVLSRFADLCREHNVYVAVGYFHDKSRENRVAFIGPDGLMGWYAKTHLTPFEDYAKGTGEPRIIAIDGIRVGAMICQDDNYTDLSRKYGVQRTDVLVIPTNDWGPVRKAHLQSTIHRTIESRFAVVRATSDGISAIISAKGERLGICDHWHHGPDMIVADVPIYHSPSEGAEGTQVSERASVRAFEGPTPYSRFGDWFVAACGVFLLVHHGIPGNLSGSRGQKSGTLSPDP